MGYIRIDWDWLRSHWGELSYPAQAVLPVLLSYPRHSCYPDQDKIARLAGISTRQVRRGLSKLEGAGWVVVKRRRYGSNRYIVHEDVRCMAQGQR